MVFFSLTQVFESSTAPALFHSLGIYKGTSPVCSVRGFFYWNCPEAKNASHSLTFLFVYMSAGFCPRFLLDWSNDNELKTVSKHGAFYCLFYPTRDYWNFALDSSTPLGAMTKILPIMLSCSYISGQKPILDLIPIDGIDDQMMRKRGKENQTQYFWPWFELILILQSIANFSPYTLSCSSAPEQALSLSLVKLIHSSHHWW